MVRKGSPVRIRFRALRGDYGDEPVSTDPEGRPQLRYGGEAGLRPQRLRLRAFLFLLRHLPPAAAWRIAFLRANRYWPRVGSPRTLNEKMLRRILKDRRSELAQRCDKLRSKEIVASLAPEVRIPQVLWTGTDLRALSRIELPDRWVLKPNNSTGTVHFGEGVLSPDDADWLASATADWLGNGPFEPKASWRRKWGYRQARQCFLVEEFVGRGPRPANDIKVHVFGGRASHVRVVENRFGEIDGGYLTPGGQPMAMRDSVMGAGASVRKPPQLAEIVEAAERIAAGFDYLRVDFFLEDEVIWFGEFGAYAGSAMLRITPRAADSSLGALWEMPAEVV